MAKKKKKSEFSKIVVVFVIAFVSLFYVSAAVYQFTAHDSYSDTLLISMTGFFSAEGGLLAYIKGKKIKHKVNGVTVTSEIPSEEITTDEETAQIETGKE